MTHRLEVELESGGNLHYELGTPSIGWLVTNNSISLSYIMSLIISIASVASS